MESLYSRNNALDVNPQGGARNLSEGGSSWLFAVTAFFTVSFFAYFFLSFRPRNGEKIFHYLFTVALFVGAIAYFSMGSGIAYSVIPTHLRVAEAISYQVFFAKYIFWVVAFPVIIIALGLVSGVSWATIFFNVALSWIWVISYLCSAYTATRYKWGFYTFGTIAYIMLAFQTLWGGRSTASRLDLGRDHTALAGYVNFLWFLYPIAFAVSEGGNVIGVTGSMIFFGILDLFLVCGTAFGFLFFTRKWDYGRMNLHFTQYGRVSSHGSGLHPEKHHGGTHLPAGTTTTGTHHTTGHTATPAGYNAGTTTAAPGTTTTAPGTHSGAVV